MPKVLLVAATAKEIEPFLKKGKFRGRSVGKILKGSSKNIAVLITGVGMVNTAFHLGSIKRGEFGVLINAGICGAFDRNLAIGEVLNITHDTLIEMGAEDDHLFISYKDLGLGGSNEYKAKNPALKKIASLAKADGITVNRVHGSVGSIVRLRTICKARTESMEGAAFLMAAEELKCKSVQLRAVSNYVEKRDKSKWNIPLALKNLNEALMDLMTEFDRNFEK